MNDRERLQAYFDEVDRAHERLRAVKPSDTRLRVIARRFVPPSRRNSARVAVTNLIRPVQRRAAEKIESSVTPLRLHLGCGGEHKSGWVNIDCVGDPVELAWNLKYGIPFGSGKVDAIFSEHLFEHLPLQSGLALMDDCFRVLKPGGIVRIGVPDAGKLLASYLGDGKYLESLHPGRPTRLIAAQELFYWHGHLTMFDRDTLALLFKAAGFPDPEQREFGDSGLDECPDTERRRAETIYMEATKPIS